MLKFQSISNSIERFDAASDIYDQHHGLWEDEDLWADAIGDSEAVWYDRYNANADDDEQAVDQDGTSYEQVPSVQAVVQPVATGSDATAAKAKAKAVQEVDGEQKSKKMMSKQKDNKMKKKAKTGVVIDNNSDDGSDLSFGSNFDQHFFDEWSGTEGDEQLDSSNRKRQKRNDDMSQIFDDEFEPWNFGDEGDWSASNGNNDSADDDADDDADVSVVAQSKKETEEPASKPPSAPQVVAEEPKPKEENTDDKPPVATNNFLLEEAEMRECKRKQFFLLLNI